ncbi:MAG: hypothetical protein ACQEP1_02615 [Nanobdellota archaeon]
MALRLYKLDKKHEDSILLSVEMTRTERWHDALKDVEREVFSAFRRHMKKAKEHHSDWGFSAKKKDFIIKEPNYGKVAKVRFNVKDPFPKKERNRDREIIKERYFINIFVNIWPYKIKREDLNFYNPRVRDRIAEHLENYMAS